MSQNRLTLQQPPLYPLLIKDVSFRYDFAISYSRVDESEARNLARLLRERGAIVYFDQFAVADTWGRPLEIHLDDVYRHLAKFCIVIISRHYAESSWTQIELASALAAKRIRKTDYILPLRLDDTDITGLPPGLTNLDLRSVSPEYVAQVALEKMASLETTGRSPSFPEVILTTQRAGDTFDQFGFDRLPAPVPLQIEDASLVSTMLGLWPDEPHFVRARAAESMYRVIARTRLNVGREKFDPSFPYTCWRTSDRVFYSTLPGVVSKDQQTFEFRIIDGGQSRLALEAVWRPRGTQWRAMAFADFHSAFEGLTADRNGCSMPRETAIRFARDHGFAFTPPVVPWSGKDEALCGWVRASDPPNWYGWDRIPSLTGAGFGFDDMLCYREACIVRLQVIHGSWRDAALWELHECIDSTLGSRVDRMLWNIGSLKILLCLGNGEHPNSLTRRANARLNLALLRMVAAENQWPMAPAVKLEKLEDMGADTWRTFRRAVDELNETAGDMHRVVPDLNDAESPQVWSPLHLHSATWRDDLWELGPAELQERILAMEAAAN